MKSIAQKVGIQNLINFAGFEINTTTAIHTKYNVSLENINLNNPLPVKWEGLYGKIPAVIDNMISGICLWDARWKIEFVNKKKASQPGAVKVLCLEIPRNEANTFIKEGRKIKSITVPKDLGKYHKIYLAWLESSIKRLNLRHVFLHIPVSEYHIYINNLEETTGMKLPELHNHLDVFGNDIKGKIHQIMKGANVDYTFLDPMKEENIKDTVESYKYSYGHLPSLYPKQNFFAFEDICEFRLMHGTKVQNGLFAMFDSPDPYTDKTTNADNSTTFLL